MSPPWPPPPALPVTPFPSRALAAVAAVAEALLAPGYWAADRLLALRPTTAQRARWRRHRGLAAALWLLAAPALVLALVLALPPALLGLLLWLPVQAKRRPFVLQHEAAVPMPEPWEPRRCRRSFTFLSANVCLLPSGLARFSNLGGSRRRAEAIGRLLAAGAAAEPSGHRQGLVGTRWGRGGGYGGTEDRGRPGGDWGMDVAAVDMEMVAKSTAMCNSTFMGNSTAMGNPMPMANPMPIYNSASMGNSTLMDNSTAMGNPMIMDNPMANPMPMNNSTAMGNSMAMGNSTLMANPTAMANPMPMDNSTLMVNPMLTANLKPMTNPTVMVNSTVMGNPTVMVNTWPTVDSVPTLELPMTNSKVMGSSTQMANPTLIVNPTVMANAWPTTDSVPTLELPMTNSTTIGNPTVMTNLTPMANTTAMGNPTAMANSWPTIDSVLSLELPMTNPTPMANSWPTVDSVPMLNLAMANPTPMTNAIPMADSTSMTNTTPMSNPTVMANSWPTVDPVATLELPMTNPTPMANPTSMANPTLMTNSTPIASSWPTIDSVPTLELPMTNPAPMTSPMANPTTMTNPTPRTNPTAMTNPMPMTNPTPMTNPPLGPAPPPVTDPRPDRLLPLPDPMPPVLSAHIPPDTDFLCLQEVFDGAAATALRRQLARRFPHVLWGVGPGGLRCGRLRVLGSGLVLASRYPLLAARFHPFPNGAREDALANKGLLLAQVLLGMGQGRRAVGYLSCTHLQAPAPDAAIRDDQLTRVLGWLRDFRQEQQRPGDLVAFSVLCGDLNFDNCSRGDAQNQRHPLFEEFWDPARIKAGQDQPWAIGTLLDCLKIYEEPVSTPEKMERTLSQPWGRQQFLAAPILPCGAPDPQAPRPWNGRRVDMALVQREPELSTEVTRLSVITQLATLSDHLPVALRLRLGPADP